MSELVNISNISEHQGYVRLVAIKGEKVVGTSIGLQIGSSMLLERLWVDPSLRKKGIGKTLLTKTEEVAKDSGAKYIIRIGMFCDAESIRAYISAVKFFVNNGYLWSIIALSKKI